MAFSIMGDENSSLIKLAVIVYKLVFEQNNECFHSCGIVQNPILPLMKIFISLHS